MNPLCFRITKAVKAANPAFDAVEEFDAIAELDRLAGEMATRPASLKFDALNLPVVVGTVKLYKLSLGAELWLEKFEGWYANEPGRCDTAALFAMAHPARTIRVNDGLLRSRTVTLQDLDTPEAAKKAVAKWAYTVTESPDDLFAAAKKLRGGARRQISDSFKLNCVRAIKGDSDAVAALLKTLDEPTPAVKDDADNIGDLYSFLIDTYGGTVEYWTWEQSADNITALLNAKVNREVRAHSDGKAEKARESWEDDAHRRFFNAARAFGQKYGIADIHKPVAPVKSAGSASPVVAPDANAVPPAKAQETPVIVAPPVTVETLPHSGSPGPHCETP